MVCIHRGLLGTVVVRTLVVVLQLGGVVWACVRATDWWAGPETDEGPDPEAGGGQSSDVEVVRGSGAASRRSAGWRGR
jgi:hypothetical protein